jgi:catalase
LSQVVTKPGSIAGRKIGIVADAGSDLTGIKRLRTAVEKRGATVLVLAPVGGMLKKGRTTLAVDRTNLTARSVEFDAVVIADGTTPTGDIKLTVLLQEAYRHCKPLAAWGAGDAVLTRAGIEPDAPGVFVHAAAEKEFTNSLIAAVGLHRAWDRAAPVMASAAPPANAPR